MTEIWQRIIGFAFCWALFGFAILSAIHLVMLAAAFITWTVPEFAPPWMLRSAVVLSMIPAFMFACSEEAVK